MKIASPATLLCSLIVLLIYAAPVMAEVVQSDYDSDGLSDITLIKTEKNKKLQWTKLASAAGAQSALGRLGQSGDQIVLAHWLGSASPQLGVVSAESGAIHWKIRDNEGQVLKLTFGEPRDLVISGADFNGNGIDDAGLLRTSQGRALWLVRFDLFTPLADGSVQAFEFGKSSKNAFFASPDGIQDWAAVISKARSGRNVLRMRNVVTGKVQSKKRFGAYALKTRPFPVRGPDAVDVLGFHRAGKKKGVVQVRALDGKSLGKFPVPGKCTVIVGNFTPEPGEEIAAITEKEMIIYNPFSATLSKRPGVKGVAVDQININSLSKKSSETNPDDGNGGGDLTQCASIRAWPSSHIYKTIGSDHFSASDVRRNTVGVVVKPGGGGPFPNCISVLDTRGHMLARIGLYARGGEWAARYYAGIGCGTDTAYNGSTLAAKARGNTGSPGIYVNFGSVCYGPIDAGVCVGSSQC